MSERQGFTIVELLIVIVVIAILAAIGIISYHGITKRAQNASVESDVREMDIAQKQYILKNGNQALPTNPDGSVNDTLVFANNPGNTIIVKLKSNSDEYCVYGYNPASKYATLAQALVVSSESTDCPELVDEDDPEEEILNPANTYSTVAIIGERLELFKQAHGSYPHTEELKDIALTLKPNSPNANQQQLYCRNDIKAIYLQIDKKTKIVYVYETATASVSERTDLPHKLNLSSICPIFDIPLDSAGYQSTGVKKPNI